MNFVVSAGEGTAAAVAPAKATRTPKARAATPQKTSRKGTAAPAVAAAVEGNGSVPAIAEMISEQEEIARLAYFFWEDRGRTGGSPEDDWFRAEQEIRARKAGAAG